MNDSRIDLPPPAATARALAALGGVLAATAVALAAYAAHGVDADATPRLNLAALFAFGHGVALASLAPAARRRLTRLALAALAAGVLLFAGSLAAAHFMSAPTSLAPLGGALMIAGWLVYAVDAVRG